MNANEKQYGGSHYKQFGIQPWDAVLDWGLGYLDGTAIKYIARWKHKGGVEDIRKAIHFLEKLIEVENGHEHVSEGDQAVRGIPGPAVVDVPDTWSIRGGGGGYWESQKVHSGGFPGVASGRPSDGIGGCALVSSQFSPPPGNYDGGTCGQELPETSGPSNEKRNSRRGR